MKWWRQLYVFRFVLSVDFFFNYQPFIRIKNILVCSDEIWVLTEIHTIFFIIVRAHWTSCIAKMRSTMEHANLHIETGRGPSVKFTVIIKLLCRCMEVFSHFFFTSVRTGFESLQRHLPMTFISKLLLENIRRPQCALDQRGGVCA